MKKTVCCMFGGKSTEHDVSLMSVSSVLANIDRDRYDVVTLGITKDGVWYLYTGDISKIADGSWCADAENITPAFICPSDGASCIVCQSGERIHIDVVFPVMHGAHAEDGTLQGLLEMANIPFVGPHCTASAVAMDKSVTKAVLNSVGIPQAKAVVATRYDIANNFDEIAAKVETLGYPVFVKPARAGSSIGVRKVMSADELKGALEYSAAYDGKVLVEEFIKGREIEVAVMGNSECGKICASACGEIIPGAEFYDYDNKYCDDTAKYYIPARLSPEVSAKVASFAKKIYNTIGCRGLSRVDFFVCDDDRIVFNEINTLPGFTSISMYPKLFMHGGMSYSEIITKLIELAFE